MPVYLVDLSLQSVTHDYAPLWQALSRMGAERAMDTTWFLDVPRPVSEVTQSLLPYIETPDRLLVVEIVEGAGWSMTHADDETKAWLKSRRP